MLRACISMAWGVFGAARADIVVWQDWISADPARAYLGKAIHVEPIHQYLAARPRALSKQAEDLTAVQEPDLDQADAVNSEVPFGRARVVARAPVTRGHSYNGSTTLYYTSRVIMWCIFMSGMTLES